ncbi:uncharacterized protein E0L32_011765 [Thyridium curvatum]|uniref:Uncharacterized protein n=1 Tax=Thyridium curvatum TaxID=1093900 RepID=A0A507BG27_9PEZI|nr:uncharacterized protein E0L32_011765 [Thyridium curvatum]TPX18316.1 hypothetical protein E0L32_011765 [Thyridium curvatum]
MPSSISNSPRKVGKPRLDKYERLLHRLYEAMVLLWLEQPVQGPHLVIHHDGSVAACRRRLSRNLAYICDYDKGGKTTTSIGIEDSTSSYVFWVATNDPRNQGRLMDFLRSILHRLRGISRVSDPNHSWLDGQEDACAQECTKFAARRIKKEARILSNTVEKCLEHLEKPPHDEKDIPKRDILQLKDWLPKFKFGPLETGYDRCRVAYYARHDPEMDTLRRLGQEVQGDPGSESLTGKFHTIRHFVGRLAEHIRISKQLVEDALRMAHILDECKASAIEPAVCASPPKSDSHTNLQGILRRMSSSGGSELEEIQQTFSRLDEHTNHESKIMEHYDMLQTQQRPIVHSEVQVLDHFHRNGLHFVDDDRFIGTSKFSCFCCKLYFRYHPANPVEPESHEQVYLNWGPFALPLGSQDPSFPEQRNVMNPLIRALGDAFFRRLRENKTLAFRHANSVTGLSRSADTWNGSDALTGEVQNETDSDSEGGAAL